MTGAVGISMALFFGGLPFIAWLKERGERRRRLAKAVAIVCLVCERGDSHDSRGCPLD